MSIPSESKESIPFLKGQIAAYDAILTAALEPPSNSRRESFFNHFDGVRKSAPELRITEGDVTRLVEFALNGFKPFEEQRPTS